VATRYTARLSGVDEIAVMLLDVLGGFEELKICTAYDIGGRRVEQFPSHVDDLKRAVPIYETLPGWPEEISGIRDHGSLPANARRYLDRLAQLLGRRVTIASVGPDRDQTIFIDRPGAAPCPKPTSRTPATT
jgi:adenylosuccinate synthase